MLFESNGRTDFKPEQPANHGVQLDELGETFPGGGQKGRDGGNERDGEHVAETSDERHTIHGGQGAFLDECVDAESQISSSIS
jgi:hypothetical protein